MKDNNTCKICDHLEEGDTLYEMSSWDGGIGFDYIHNIKYCPVCGRKLNSYVDLKTTVIKKHISDFEFEEEYDEI